MCAFVLILTIAGCGSAGNEDASEFIPDVPLECVSGQAADCAGDDLPVFVGLSEGLAGSACDDFLTGMTAVQRRRSFLASGSSRSTAKGNILTATINKWENDLGGPIDVLPSGTYQVCAFIDTNGNGEIDTSEPVGEGQLIPGRTDFILSVWSPAYN